MDRDRGKINRSSTGFTLTELVVVIGIIGVIFGLLTPVIVRTRKAGRDLQCKSNLRQIFQAYKIYVSDNQGRKPMVTNRPSLGLNKLPSISDVLAPYCGRKVFRCPLDKQEFFETEGSSYEFNVIAYGRVVAQTDPLITAVQMSVDPASIPAFYDYECFHGKENGGRGKNAVFGDGHVETF
ncbi:MAG: prepilin-type N-terminal cleavage/methylation domain-containing protein [Planctomycetes bacterium]|nr:prepilin-type N-terminal cleavage/methylation domain-containing protein [Planctomycetota bacterium]